MPTPVSSGVNSQGNTYTNYSNGGYSYNNAPSSSNNNSGSHYYSPSGGTSGFYTQNGGKSGGGYSFYQNSCAAPAPLLSPLTIPLPCPSGHACIPPIVSFSPPLHTGRACAPTSEEPRCGPRMARQQPPGGPRKSGAACRVREIG